MALYKTGNPVPSSAMPDVWDNNRVQDEILNSEELEVETRTGIMTPTWKGVLKKNEDEIEETRQNLIPLSRQYMTLAAAQADIANIPEGSTTYYRSPDDSALAIEVMNVGGTLQPTGRRMISAGYVDALRDLVATELAKIMAFGAAQTTDAYPDIAELILDSVGHAVYRRYADGTSQFPALMIGSGIELVQIAGGGFVCQMRATGEEIFNISALGNLTHGSLTTWFADDDSVSDYSEIHMDGQGRIFRRVRTDGTVEQVGDDTPDDDASEFPMVASVDGNIIAVDGSDVTQITNDSGVSNIAPVHMRNFCVICRMSAATTSLIDPLMTGITGRESHCAFLFT